jgi:hypothetical protein
MCAHACVFELNVGHFVCRHVQVYVCPTRVTVKLRAQRHARFLSVPFTAEKTEKSLLCETKMALIRHLSAGVLGRVKCGSTH